MMTKLVRNPLAMVLVGAALGILGGVVLGGVLLLLLNVGPTELAAAPVATSYDIEAVVEEDYINRIMVENANSMTGPVTLVAGHLDLRPGAVADFVVQIKLGPLQPVVDGTVGFVATDDGSSIEVQLLDVKMGRLRLNRLVPSGALDDVNADIKRLLIDRIGSQGLIVLDVQSDDTSLRLHFGRGL